MMFVAGETPVAVVQPLETELLGDFIGEQRELATFSETPI